MPNLRFTKLQLAAHLGSLIPLVTLLWDYFNDHLTVNPIQDITFRTGKAALILLVLSLACTPANALLNIKQAAKIRRLLGLYAFIYVCLHLLTFVGLDYGFSGPLIVEAIVEKRYALVGFAAFLILLPLALTSTKGWMTRLGKNWKRLHRLVYLAAILAVLHYVWLVKSDFREPLAYGAVVALLLAARVPTFKNWVAHWRRRAEQALNRQHPASDDQTDVKETMKL